MIWLRSEKTRTLQGCFGLLKAAAEMGLRIEFANPSSWLLRGPGE